MLNLKTRNKFGSVSIPFGRKWAHFNIKLSTMFASARAPITSLSPRAWHVCTCGWRTIPLNSARCESFSLQTCCIRWMSRSSRRTRGVGCSPNEILWFGRNPKRRTHRCIPGISIHVDFSCKVIWAHRKFGLWPPQRQTVGLYVKLYCNYSLGSTILKSETYNYICTR